MNNYNIIVTKEFNIMVDRNLSRMKILSKSYVHSISLTISYFIFLLEKFPFIFPRFFLPNDISFLRKVVIAKRYYLLYQIKDNTVEVLYFVDGRRSCENYLLY